MEEATDFRPSFHASLEPPKAPVEEKPRLPTNVFAESRIDDDDDTPVFNFNTRISQGCGMEERTGLGEYRPDVLHGCDFRPPVDFA